MLLSGDPVGFAFFFRWTARKGGTNFLGGCDLHKIYGIVATLLSFLCTYDNLTLKLHQEKRSYPDKRWLFIGRFKAGSVLGRGVFLLAASKKVSKSIHPNKVIIAINSPIYK